MSRLSAAIWNGKGTDGGRGPGRFLQPFELFASLPTGSAGNLQVSGPLVGFASDVLTFFVE